MSLYQRCCRLYIWKGERLYFHDNPFDEVTTVNTGQPCSQGHASLFIDYLSALSWAPAAADFTCLLECILQSLTYLSLYFNISSFCISESMSMTQFDDSCDMKTPYRMSTQHKSLLQTIYFRCCYKNCGQKVTVSSYVVLTIIKRKTKDCRLQPLPPQSLVSTLTCVIPPSACTLISVIISHSVTKTKLKYVCWES